MRSSVLLVALFVIVASATSGFAAPSAEIRVAEVRVKEERPGLLTKAKVPAIAATATARSALPRAELVSSEIEQEGGKLIYSFDFKTKGKSGTDEVNVDAMTGTILKVEHESPKAEAKEKAADLRKPAPKRR